MHYIGQENFIHSSDEKIGILVTNLGTPEAPTKKALRKYLKQFLSDPRVIEIPKPIWWVILNLIILNTRPGKSAKLYQSIWTERGSPLKWHTEDQMDALKHHFKDQLPPEIYDRLIIRYAMRYGEPSIGATLQNMQSSGANKITVLPLYPQYAASTTGSTFDAIAAQMRKTRWLPALKFISSYHDNPAYIKACATHIQRHWEQHGRADKLLFSFHGLPKFHLEKGDPYYCQCQKTARLISQTLDLDEDLIVTTFQSRFGRTEWLKPYTEDTLKSLPAKGIKRLDVFCPGFASDCLETLEEIASENKQYFLDAGGEEYRYIPALNSNDEHIHALGSILSKNISDWLGEPHRNPEACQRHYLGIKDSYPDQIL